MFVPLSGVPPVPAPPAVNALRAPARDSIVDRCDNWGAWCRFRTSQGETASFEGSYRSPQPWHALGPPGIRRQVDATDGALVESAVCTLEIYQHALLRAWHVNRLAEPICLRLAAKAAGELRGRTSGFDAALAMAYGLLGTALAQPAVLRRTRARQRVAAILGPSPGLLTAASD